MYKFTLVLITRSRALLISSFCLSMVVLASLWSGTQLAKNQFNHATSRAISTGLLLPDKGAITPEAAITVNSLSDVANNADGLCTLREAITAANNNTASGAGAGECAAGSSSGSDMISFAGVNGTINLTGALPNVSSSMTINGPGSNLLTVRRDTGGDYRIFNTSGSPVSISGLTITNGRTAAGAPGGQFGGNPGGEGGGILNSGNLTLNDVIVNNNRTGNGGTVSQNTGGSGGAGAGIRSSGSLTMMNSAVSNNISGNGGVGESGGSGGRGGGISFNGNTLTMTNCVVTGNAGGDGVQGILGGGGSGGAGGGINIDSASGPVALTNVIISGNNGGNAAPLGNGGGGGGGGLTTSSGVNVTMTNCTVSSNGSGQGGSGFSGAGGFGGGIINGGPMTMFGCTVNDNFTRGPSSGGMGLGGGIYNANLLTMVNSTVSGNRAHPTDSGRGGGIFNSAAIRLTNCTITENIAYSCCGFQNGQGIHTSGPATVRNTIIANNGPSNVPDVTGDFTSQGHNLIGKATLGSNHGSNGDQAGFVNGNNGDQVGTIPAPINALLSPLANNGGPTFTHALLSTSPALDAGDNCVTDAVHCGDANIPQINTDQRGFSRLADGPDVDTTATVDIGACETQVSLANLPDTSTNEDTQLLVGFDPGDPSTITSITATSSNATVVPNDSAHLSAALTGASGVVTINPAANLFGTTNITVTVNRTVGSENKTFLLTVVPVNEVPSFTKGADQTVNEDAGAQSVNGWATNISPGPGDESGQILTFQVTNNTNAALFSAGPAISSTGTLTYTTAANANGSATITINLKDDGGTANGGGDTSATQAFTITVNSVNDAPTFTKGADQTVNNNAGAQSVANWATNLSRGAADEFGQALTFQITVNSNPGLFATPPAVNSSGTLSYSPLTTAGGTATITVVLKDSGGTANGGVDTSAAQSFNITVNPIGGFINFSAANYDTTESSGFATLTVKRTGDLTRAVNVDYASSGDNGLPCSTPSATATPKCDFTTALGTLSFAAGEDTKTVNILISQDSFVEGPETFFLNLSNQTGGSALASPSTATNTIADDVTEPPTNLIDDVRNFVRQHYHDFLNREPDASGWDFWSNQITSCGSDAQCAEVRRIDVSASFFLSIEFQQSGYLVERFYKVAYGNALVNSTFNGQHQLAVPAVRFSEFLKDTQRIGRGVVVLAPGWEQALENNKQAYALEFVQTTRFTSQHSPTLSPTTFVDRLNTNAGGVLSASERQTAINVFGGAPNSSNVTARAQVVRMVADDIDLYNTEYNRAFVLAQYFGYLRRNPNDAPESTLDYTGYDFWLTKLNQFNGNYINAEMVKAFLSSIEYRQRFGP